MPGRHILSGVVACLSGFADAEQRATITENVQRHGGEVRPELTDKVTHLIANTLRGAKVRRVIKGPSDTSPHLVPLLWLERSIEEGRKEAETDYDPREALCTAYWHPTSGPMLAKAELFGQKVRASLVPPLVFMRTRSSRLAPDTRSLTPQLSCLAQIFEGMRFTIGDVRVEAENFEQADVREVCSSTGVPRS